MTAPDPIRDEAVKVLAEALDIIGRPTPVIPLLDASPTLARRLSLGTAWDLAVAALPEGVYPAVMFSENRGGAVVWIAFTTPEESGDHAYGATPDEALAALAAKLGSGL